MQDERILGLRDFQTETGKGKMFVSFIANTVYGEIKVDIHRKGKKLTVQVVVPDGTTCELVFPNGKSKQLSGGNHTVEGN